MSNLIGSVSAAITTLKRLKEISDHIKDAEFKNLLADLSLELADVKLRLSEIMDENTQLKDQIKKLQNVDGEPCPRCRKHGWSIESSKPDSTFGALGGIRRTYKCSLCAFTEESLVTP